MVLPEKRTTFAYRCPHCGSGVLSAIDVFSFGSGMVKLKCTCGKSEALIETTEDHKVHLSVPCILCRSSHHFTLSSSLFFGKELFALPCPYTGINIAFLGEINLVKAELAKSELELLDLMEQSGIKSFELSEEEKQNSITDPQIREVVMFVINDLDAEGKIDCKCKKEDNGRQYDAEILDDGILVTCRKCRASRFIPTDSGLAANAFLNIDRLHLE
ncbi:MAG: hypothetical protein IJR88_05755 [Clostridia bacterium]|nr:hypothetical protein [Clostridia bacterium]